MSVNAYRPNTVADPLSAPSRVRSWRVEILDRYDQSLGFTGEADAGKSGVVSWDIAANENSTVGLTGTLVVRGELTVGGVPVDWSQHRIRIWEAITGLGEWPLGVLIPALVAPSHSWRDTEWAVPLVGKLQVIQRDRLTAPWAISTTTAVTGRIIQLLKDIGEGNRSVTETAAKLPAVVWWPSGTSKLTLINEMSGAIGHQGLRADPTGLIRSAPYVLPSNRPVSRAFAADSLTLLTPEWDEEWNLAEVPNVYLARSAEVNGVTFEAVAEDRNPDRPTSIPRRGGRVVTVEDGVEANSTASLQAYAERRLSEEVAPSSRIDVEHMTVPTVDVGEIRGLWVGMVVTHTRPGHSSTVVVEKMAWSSSSHTCKATWRVI